VGGPVRNTTKGSRTMKSWKFAALGALALAAVGASPARAQSGGVPAYNHIVVVIEENTGYDQIIGNSAAPYINKLAQGGALMTDSHGVTHPSEPNYLALFSGSTQGVTGDPTLPNNGSPFSTPNLGAALFQAGKSFGMYSEDLPTTGSTVDFTAGNTYASKHNPYVDWQPTDPAHPQPNAVPASGNMPFTNFQLLTQQQLAGNGPGFNALPSVSFVAPNQNNDMHGTASSATGNALINAGDVWLQNNLDAYAQWAKTHNSLLIVTWDEDDFTAANHIATILYGAKVTPGQYGDTINHYNVLRTIEDSFGVAPVGASDSAAPITSPFVKTVPEPASMALLGAGAAMILGLARRRRPARA
jgi:acid phosphatase